jgi:hypothetical protein
MRSNNALLSDAFSSPLRAQRGAAKRERWASCKGLSYVPDSIQGIRIAPTGAARPAPQAGNDADNSQRMNSPRPYHPDSRSTQHDDRRDW